MKYEIRNMKYEIKNYCYDNLGYTYDELNEFKKTRSKQKWYILRIKIELWEWKRLGTSVAWLRPIYRYGKCYHKGAYSSILHELQTIKRYKESVVNENTQ
jgi:hypothetical protein